MPRKKSLKQATQRFKLDCNDLMQYLQAVQPQVQPQVQPHLLNGKHVSWSYDYGVIRLYREFEKLVLECLVGAINNNTSTLSQITGYDFPAHLTDGVCRYLVVGNGYFDFKGRDDLIRILKRYIPDNHYLIAIVKKNVYKDALEKLSALRNFAAHGSKVAKKAALKAVNQKKVGSSGCWLKRQGRFVQIVDKLKQLADEIEAQAPY
jgi:hypothetical protein